MNIKKSTKFDLSIQNQVQKMLETIKTELSETMDLQHRSWLTITNACKYLNIGKTKMYDLINNGKIPCHYLGGTLMFYRTEIDQSIIFSRNIVKRKLSDKELQKFESIK